MTERKPPGSSWESFVDAQVRRAMEDGAFDDLPGQGRPLENLDEPHDAAWWVRDLVRREKLPADDPALGLLREVEKELEELDREHRLEIVRRRLESLAERVRRANALSVRGAPTRLPTPRVEDLLRRWEERRTRRGTR